MKRCEKMIQKGRMPEPRRCRFKAGHDFRCSPDLTGMVVDNLVVLKRSAPYTYRGREITRWVVKDVQTNRVFKSRTMRVIHEPVSPEYMTIVGHYHWIFKSTKIRHKTYKGMPFYDGWNITKGGSYQAGVKWIVENLGSKPGPEWSLDIIEHTKGFVPGNLRWAMKNEQVRNRQHRTLGKYSLEELRVELFRHGYDIIARVR